MRPAGNMKKTSITCAYLHRAVAHRRRHPQLVQQHDGHSDSDIHADSNSNCHPHRNCNADRNRYTDCYSCHYTECYAYCYSNSHGYSYGHSQTDTDAKR